MTMTTSNLEQIGKDSTDGLFVGPALDSAGNPYKLAFYGGTPVARRSGNVQVAANATTGLGSIVAYGCNFSTLTVTTCTVMEQTTAIAELTNVSSVVFVSKPTHQAGLGIAGARVSAVSTLALAMVNVSAGNIVPTSTDNWQVLEVKPGAGLNTTATLSPVPVAASTTVEQTFTVTGAVPGTLAVVNRGTSQANVGIVGVRVVGANSVAITYCNPTGATVTPTTSDVYNFAFLPNLVPATPILNYGINGSLLFASTAISTVGTAATITPRLATTDLVVGVNRPNPQSNAYSVQVLNSTGALQGVNVCAISTCISSSEICNVAIYKPTLGPVFQLTTAALQTTTVPATTTIEMTSTVLGLVISSNVWVNKPAVTAGLGVTNARVVSTNTLAVTYMNFTSTGPLTVPAETYQIGSTPIQPPGPQFWSTTPYGYYQASVLPGEGQDGLLVNEMQAALVGMNLIKGTA